MNRIRQQLLIFITIKEIRAIVEENTKVLKSSLQLKQTIRKR